MIIITDLGLWLLAYLILGFCVGIAAGLLGVGGGGILVPSLTSFFIAQGFAYEHVVHMALGTSMATIILTSISSTRAHDKLHNVLWPVVKQIAPGIIVGTYLATFIAAVITTVPLALIFVAFMIFVAAQLILDVKPAPSRELPGLLGRSVVGLIIGGISALVAIGGGALSVPFMTWCNVPLKKAIGTSAAIGLPIALAGSIGYFFNGQSVSNIPPYTFGYIYLPAFVCIALTSTLAAPLGVRMSQRISVGQLKKIFAIMVILLSLKMVYSLVYE